MRIALTGAHSTGKSTIFNELKSELFFHENGIEFLESETRKIANKLNEGGDEENQTLLMNGVILKAFNDWSITDRCVLDVACYTKYLWDHDKISYEFYLYTKQAVKDIMPLYDYIFYFYPEFDIVDDGVRSNSKEFREDIVENFNYFIEKSKIRIIPVSGSVEERKNFILKVLGA